MGASAGRSAEKPEASTYGSLLTFGLDPNLELLSLLSRGKIEVKFHVVAPFF